MEVATRLIIDVSIIFFFLFFFMIVVLLVFFFLILVSVFYLLSFGEGVFLVVTNINLESAVHYVIIQIDTKGTIQN